MPKKEVKVWGGIGEKKSKRTNQWAIQDRIYDSNGLCPSLTNYKANYWIIVYKEKDSKVKQMTNDEIRKLNDEIEEMETDYWNSKFDYEQQRADILLGTDFGAVIGKAKPTVAEKDAYIEQTIGELRLQYRELRATLESKKRLFQIMLKEIGDNE